MTGKAAGHFEVRLVSQAPEPGDETGVPPKHSYEFDYTLPE